MTKLLKIDEMLDVIVELCPETESATLVGEVEQLADKLAEAITRVTGFHAGGASYQGAAFAGTCVGFYKKTPDQPVPDVFESLDPDEEIELLDEDTSSTPSQ